MRSVARTAFLMIALTLVSKFIGFFRELLLANYYGAGYIMDSYVMATAIPGVIFAGIFAAISTAYMPVFSNKMENEGLEQANRYTSEIFNLSLAVSILASIIGMIFSDQLVAIFASGFHGQTAQLTSFFIKITFSYVIFSSTMGLMEAFLQYKGIFLPQVVAGYVQNGCIIAIIIISSFTTYYILPLGWLLGYGARMLMMFCLAKRKGFRYTFTVRVNDAVKNILMLAIPVFIGSSINQINIFIDKTLASRLPEGSVAALNYGSILITMISGLTISILVTISYPKLAQASALNDNERFSSILSTGINLVAIIAIPCSLGSILYNKIVVQIIYERGAFDTAATAFTSSAFLYYSIGLVFMSVISLLTQAYYSMHNMKTPMIFSGIGVIINTTLNLILIQPMAHRGLALSTSIASICTAGLMYYGFRKKYPDIILVQSKRKLLYIVISGCTAVGFSWFLYQLLTDMVGIPRIMILFIIITFAGIIHLMLLYLFKVKEMGLLKQIIIKR